MKRIVALLMAVMMLLGLMACGNETLSGNNGDRQGEETVLVPPNSICSVWMKINPEFLLYLDENNSIVGMSCLNKDAEKAFEGVDVANVDFENGLRILLDAVYDAGYVQRNEMAIVWGIERLSEEEFDDSVIVNGFAAATEAFANDRNLGLSASMRAVEQIDETIGKEETDNEEEPLPPPEEENPFGPDVEILERDGEGHIILTREYDSSGSEVVNGYDSEGRYVSSVVTRVDGSVVRYTYSYYSNGNVKTIEIDDAAAGIYEYWNCSEDGTTRTCEAERYTITETYHPNGQCASVARQAKPGYDLGDRTYEKYTYDENGQTLTHHIIRTNGWHITGTYHSEDAFTLVIEVNGVVDHTEYWVGNDHIGGIDSNGNPYGITHSQYTGNGGSGGTIGVG